MGGKLLLLERKQIGEIFGEKKTEKKKVEIFREGTYSVGREKDRE